MSKTSIPPERLRTAAMTKRSTLYAWMLENHDTFAATIAEVIRPNWIELAKTFGEEGLRDAEDKPPTPEATRQTWWKVRKTVWARRAKTKLEPIPKPLSVPAPPTITIPKRTVDAQPTSQEKSESQSTPITGNTTLDEFWEQIDER